MVKFSKLSWPLKSFWCSSIHIEQKIIAKWNRWITRFISYDFHFYLLFFIKNIFQTCWDQPIHFIVKINSILTCFLFLCFWNCRCILFAENILAKCKKCIFFLCWTIEVSGEYLEHFLVVCVSVCLLLQWYSSYIVLNYLWKIFFH